MTSAPSFSYIARKLDTELARAIQDRDWVVVYGGRQTGKTLALHNASQNADTSTSRAYVDLQPLREIVDEAAWIQSLSDAVLAGMTPVPQGAPDLAGSIRDFPGFLMRLVEQTGTDLILLLDEVSAIPPTFRTSFFTSLRALFNLRSDTRRGGTASRIAVVFAGSFDHRRAIDNNDDSPFNVLGAELNTSNFDFDADQVTEIARSKGVSQHAEEVMALTGGHPYLSFRSADLFAQGLDSQRVTQRLLSTDFNLGHLMRQLKSRSNDVLDLAKTIRDGGQPYVEGVDEAFDELNLLGLLREDGSGGTTIRCTLYREALSKVLDGRGLTTGTLPPVSNLERHVLELRQIATGGEDRPLVSAILAGAAMEGALILRLREMDPTALVEAIDRVRMKIKDGKLEGIRPIKPDATLDDLALVYLVHVAEAAGLLGRVSTELANIVRLWRNLIHPERLVTEFPSGLPDALGKTAVFVMELLLQELHLTTKGGEGHTLPPRSSRA